MTEHGEVLVVGAGVIGLTTAVCLAERGFAVRVRAAQAPAGTTSAVAGALIGGPVTAEPLDAAVGWNRTSLEEFERLAADPDSGVRMARGRMVSRQGAGTPEWAPALPGFEPCAPEEFAGFPVAFWFSSPVVDMPAYLDHLAGRLAAAGGEVTTGEVASVKEAATLAPAVVNCTGLGAMRFAEDPRMKPVRGQHVVVENPGLTEFFYERSQGAALTSFIPHARRLVLGGTVEPGEWSLEPDPAVTEDILRRCAAVEPRIAGAKVIGVDVGLRPGRAEVRLDEERVDGARVVHNYGHGGVGVALSWGCARQVERMLTGG